MSGGDDWMSWMSLAVMQASISVVVTIVSASVKDINTDFILMSSSRTFI